MKNLLMAVLLTMLAALSACDTQNVTNTTPGGDNVAPTIAVSGLTNNATVSGTVNINATATDAAGVTNFTMRLDGTLIASASAGPINYVWDTTTATNGARTFVFEARDAAANLATTTITVTVNN